MFEARHRRQYQFVHDRRIIKCKRAGKEPIADDPMRLGCDRTSPPSPQRAAIAPNRGRRIRHRPKAGVRCSSRRREARAILSCVNMKTSCLTCPKRAHGRPGRCARVQLRGTGLGGRSRTPGLPPVSAINSSGAMRTLAKSTGAASIDVRERVRPAYGGRSTDRADRARRDGGRHRDSRQSV